MSCYLRHLKPVYAELGLEPATKEERKLIDLAVRSAVGMAPGDKCNEVWKVVKARLQDPAAKEALLGELRKSLKV